MITITDGFRVVNETCKCDYHNKRLIKLTNFHSAYGVKNSLLISQEKQILKIENKLCDCVTEIIAKQLKRKI